MEVGLFGKLPSHGDFLRRRASDAFVDAWDAWLQACMAASRAGLGERWLGVYLTSPAWRFVCAPGTCGQAPVIGLMVPSVDRVGRYFPLTLVAELPPDASLIAAARESAPFFESAERLLIETLAAEPVDFERFDECVIALGEVLGPAGLPPPVVFDAAAGAILGGDGTTGWQLPIGAPEHLAPAFEQLLLQHLSAVYHPLALWWTEGSSLVEPSCLIARGLPPPDAFGALLDGAWAQHRWRSIPVLVNASAAADDTLVDEATPWRVRSAAASDVGLVREVNQDAFVERVEVGLWAVADGLGGHRDGEIASRMVCDALADFAPGSSFDETVDAACDRLQQVNQHLLRSATRSLVASRSASTVVVLLVRGTRCAVLWAGDSRAYRWRAGELEQLTRDHSPGQGAAPEGRQESSCVTRAVGVEPELELDLRRDDVRAGDRFLLCSDGLTRTVPATQIRSWMEHGDIRAAVDGLVRASLDAGAPDNVTVLIAEACADGP
jgi:type VI secretion system protein ImpM